MGKRISLGHGNMYKMGKITSLRLFQKKSTYETHLSINKIDSVTKVLDSLQFPNFIMAFHGFYFPF